MDFVLGEDFIIDIEEQLFIDLIELKDFDMHDELPYSVPVELVHNVHVVPEMTTSYTL